MNLSTKIILSMLFVLAFLMGGITYLITRWQQSAITQSTHHYSNILGETISNSIAMEMSLGRSDLVQETLEKVGRESTQIRALRIFDPGGQVLRSIDRAEIGQRIDLSSVRSHFKDVPTVFEHQRKGEPLLSFLKPFPNGPSCQRCHDAKERIIGYLLLDLSGRPAADLMLSTQKFVLGGMTATFLILAGSILLIISRWVQRPLSKVVDGMKKVEGGNLDARVYLTSRDELESVARTFNSMVETLKKNKEDMEMLHQRELERTQRMATLGEMAQAIAHEIRNPIAGVSEAVKLIRDGLEKDDPRERVFDEIHFQSDRIAKIVANLLLFARHTTPQFSFVDIHEIIERSLTLFSFQFEDQRVHVEKEFQTGFPNIYADPDYIQQVLMNIILNAIQAMPEGGTLRLKMFYKLQEKLVHLSMTDTGKGIPEETMPKIFKPFYSSKAKGAGLGLAIVEKIVQQHGGRVVIYSEVNAGTTVEILLPTYQPIKKEGS